MMSAMSLGDQGCEGIVKLLYAMIALAEWHPLNVLELSLAPAATRGSKMAILTMGLAILFGADGSRSLDPISARRPDHRYRHPNIPCILHYICRSTVSAGRLAVPYRYKVVRAIYHKATSIHMGFRC